MLETMKMKYLHIFALLWATLWLLSCTRETVPNGETDGDGIVLDFFCVSPSTKAGISGTKPGEDQWNENLISTIDVFLYPAGGSGNAVAHRRYTPNNTSGQASISIFTDDSFINNTLVPGDNIGFWVYAIANYPGTLVANENNLDGTSITALKTLSLSCDFSAAANHRQSSFVMDGESFISPIEKGSRIVARGEIGLKRVAAKITVQLNIKDTIQIRKTATINDVEVHYTEIWEPMTSGERSIEMYLENGVKRTTLAAKPIEAENSDYFSYTGNRMVFNKSTATEDAGFPWVTDPTYVYPQHWEYASKTAPTKEPTLKLILPWRRLSRIDNGIQINATQKQFYYKIIIPDDTRADDGDDTFLRNFVRNNWYNFRMDVGMLGSETDEAAVAVSGYYYVVDWQDRDVVLKEAAIGKARFLSIEDKEHTIYNEESLNMLYTSSHPVALNVSKGSTTLDITATKVYYGDKAENSTVGGGIVKVAASGNADYAAGQKYIEYNATQRKARNNNEDWVKVEGDYVKFHHTLNNDFSSSDFDSAPYIIRFNLYHADHTNDNQYKQPVKITQYPAMYLKTIGSNGNVFVNNKSYASSSGGVIKDDSNNILGSLVNPNDLSSGSANTNMYVVYLSVLPADSSSLIGDPRTDGSTLVVNTLNNLNPEGHYYRPAAENSQSIIAPAVMIASSYGRTYATLYENSRTRCAAYQESGYPAGRWRLPTSAEIEFFVMLSENGCIPTLFNPGQDSNTQYSYYWAAGGYGYTGSDFKMISNLTATTNNNGVGYYTGSISNWSYTTHMVYTRCVYDIWYWGEDPDSSHLTSWSGYQTTK